MTMYTQAQMDEVTNQARATVLTTDALLGEQDARTRGMLAALRSLIEADNKVAAYALIDKITARYAPRDPLV